jgi:hypothetical protein
VPSIDLIPLAEGTETIVSLDELLQEGRTGFIPDTSLVEAPYPFPSATSYPGDSTIVGLYLSSMSEGAKTLTPLTES